MTDQEMLDLCLQAFTALQTSEATRNFLVLNSQTAEFDWRSNPRVVLAAYMENRLKAHLGMITT